MTTPGMTPPDFTVKFCSLCQHKSTYTYTAQSSNKTTFPACSIDSKPLSNAGHDCGNFVPEVGKEVDKDV